MTKSKFEQSIASVLPGKAVNLIEHIWPLIWDKDETLVLLDTQNRKYYYSKGDRVIYPKQLEFIISMFEHKATLNAGGAGGGKSVILMWAVIIYLIWCGENGFPNAIGKIFAESMDTIISRQFKLLKKHVPPWLGHTRGGSGGMINEFVLEDEYYGGVIEYRTTDDFEVKQKGVEAAVVAIEESANQPEEFFKFMVTRARWTWKGIPLEHVPILLCTNPVGIGVGWHVETFVNEWDPEVRSGRMPPMWVVDIRGKKTWFKGYHLIESFAMDNPSQSDDYIRSLTMMDDAHRDTFLFGRWDKFQGSFFNLEPKAHTFPTYMQIPIYWPRCLAVDYAEGHTGCAYAGALDPNGCLWVYQGFEERGLKISQFKKRMSEVFVENGAPTVFTLQVCDPTMFPKVGSYGGDKTFAEILNQYDEYGQYQFFGANNSRIPGWQAVQEMLSFESTEYIDKKTFKRNVEITRMPKLRFRQDLAYLWQSFKLVQRDKKNSEDVVKTKGEYGPGRGDDAPDTIRYMVMGIVRQSFKDMSDIAKPTRYASQRRKSSYV